MQWSRYRREGVVEWGVWLDEELFSLESLDDGLNPSQLLTSDPVALLQHLRRRRSSRVCPVAVERIHFLPPTQPQKILCAGLNYRDHARETGAELPSSPTFFIRFPDTLCGSGEAIPHPVQSDAMDFEGELLVVLGQAVHGKLQRHEALAAVAGYGIFNDISMRDYQFRTSQWTMGKNFPHSGSCGARVTTTDELPEGANNLYLRTEVNGDRLQDGNTADLIFDVAALIQTLAEVMPLHPGDLIATGTPAGVGFARKPPRYLQPGDTIRVEIEGLGVLENPVIPARLDTVERPA